MKEGTGLNGWEEGEKYVRNLQIEIGSRYVSCEKIKQLRRMVSGVLKTDDETLLAECENDARLGREKEALMAGRLGESPSVASGGGNESKGVGGEGEGEGDGEEDDDDDDTASVGGSSTTGTSTSYITRRSSNPQLSYKGIPIPQTASHHQHTLHVPNTTTNASRVPSTPSRSPAPTPSSAARSRLGIPSSSSHATTTTTTPSRPRTGTSSTSITGSTRTPGTRPPATPSSLSTPSASAGGGFGGRRPVSRLPESGVPTGVTITRPGLASSNEMERRRREQGEMIASLSASASSSSSSDDSKPVTASTSTSGIPSGIARPSHIPTPKK